MFEEFYEMYWPEEQEVVALIRSCIGSKYNNKGDFGEMTVLTLDIVFCDTGKVHTKKASKIPTMYFINRKFIWFSILLVILVEPIINWDNFFYYESRGSMILFILGQIAVMEILILILRAATYALLSVWAHPIFRHQL